MRSPVSALLLALGVLAACGTPAATSYDWDDGFEHVDLLLVVGLVTENKVRILYEALSIVWEGDIDVVVNRNNTKLAEGEFSVEATRVAQIFELEGLDESTEYIVHFQRDGRDETVTFRTMDGPGTGERGASKLSVVRRMIVHSCDRFVDVKSDDDFVIDMSKREDKNYDIMVHLGDNIYVDNYAAAHMNATFEEAMEDYRSLYRRGWSRKQMSKLLRHGSHWMEPDDHEVLNALSPDMIEKGKHLNLIYAGRRAAYEYQLQLHQDIPPFSKAREPGSESFFRALHFGNTGYLFVDTRFSRSFRNFDNTKYPLTGPDQFREISKVLKDWSTRKDIENIVGFTSVPLFRPTIYGAIVTNWAEGDKYPLHPDLRSNTFALAEAFLKAGENKKNTILMAGDFHCFYPSEVCRTTPEGKKNCLDSIIASGITRGSEGLSSLKLCVSFMIDFGVLSPQRIVDKATGNVWTEQEYRHAYPLNNYAVLETSESGEITWHRVLRDPNMVEYIILKVWFEYGSLSVPILLVAALLLAIVGASLGFLLLKKLVARVIQSHGAAGVAEVKKAQ